MKKILFLMAIMPVLFFSCSEYLEISQENVVPEKDYVSIVSGFGFNTIDIVDNGEYLVAEEDIMFYKTDLDEMEPTTRQARTSTIMDDYHRVGITIGVEKMLGSNILQAAKDASTHWNAAAEGYVKIISVQSYDQFNPGPGMGLISIRLPGRHESALPDDVIARATFPLNGKPGSTILINTQFIRENNINQSQLIYNIVHELGHCFGLRHTNWRKDETSNPAERIPGTYDKGTNPDPNSVMNSGTAKNSWKGFSAYDKVAIKILYSAKPAGTRPLYLHYNSNNKNSFYTSYLEESYYYADNLQYYWDDISGQSFCVQGYVLDSPGTGRAPLIRLFREKVKNCTYTTSFTEAEQIIRDYNYKYDPSRSSYIQGYVFTTQQPGTVPIYRLYSPSRNNTLLTTSYSTAMWLRTNQDYRWEAGTFGNYIIGYIYPYK